MSEVLPTCQKTLSKISTVASESMNSKKGGEEDSSNIEPVDEGLKNRWSAATTLLPSSPFVPESQRGTASCRSVSSTQSKLLNKNLPVRELWSGDLFKTPDMTADQLEKPSTPDMVTQENNLAICREKLKAMYDYSVNEMLEISHDMVVAMTTGLQKHGEMLKMLPSYVTQLPKGGEEGDFFALDLGGTNLRVLHVKLKGDGQHVVQSRKMKVSKQQMVGDHHDLFGGIAEEAQSFLKKECGHLLSEDNSGNRTIWPLGFTFSFPVRQEALAKGVLTNWNKGFEATGCVGQEICGLLQQELDSRLVPLRCYALVNDTTGTLMASAVTNTTTKVGAIVGTGLNVAYVEKAENCIGRDENEKKILLSLEDQGDGEEKMMVINTEIGNFSSKSLKRQHVDIELDQATSNVNEQHLEKMVSGHYLGEIVMRTLSTFQNAGLAFVGCSKKWSEAEFVTADMAKIHGDPSLIDDVLQSLGFKNYNETTDKQLLLDCCEAISWRSVRLTASMLHSVLMKMNTSDASTIAIDGTVYKSYPEYRERVGRVLEELLENSNNINRDVTVVDACDDGSGIGAAAVLACLKKED